MPTAVRPARDKNAIEEIAFVVRLAQPLSTEAMGQLESVREALKDALPAAGQLTGVTVTVPPGGLPMVQNQKAAGLFLQRLREDQRSATWSLKVDEHAVVVNCTDYTRWAQIWPEAKHFIAIALKAVKADLGGINGGALQVVDRFIYDSPPESIEYALTDVFQEDSPYLTPNVKAVGRLWHVYQGSFSEFALEGTPGRLLTVLNLSSSITGDSKLVTTIDHLAQVDLAGSIKGGAVAGFVLDELFQRLHDANRAVLESTLSLDMLRAIGMRQ
jgi:uncharacterized protein (TIGR04255 family)